MQSYLEDELVYAKVERKPTPREKMAVKKRVHYDDSPQQSYNMDLQDECNNRIIDLERTVFKSKSVVDLITNDQQKNLIVRLKPIET